MKSIVLKFLFCLFLIVVINKVADLITPKFYGNEQLFNKYTYAKEIDSDVYLMGSSRTYRHIDPFYLEDFFSEKDIKFFNIGSSSQNNPESFYVCKNIFPELANKNKTVVLEIAYYRSIDKKNFNSIRSQYYWDASSTLSYMWFCLKAKRFNDLFLAGGMWFKNQLGLISLKEKFKSVNKDFNLNHIGSNGFVKLKEKTNKYKNKEDRIKIENEIKRREKSALANKDTKELTDYDVLLLNQYDDIFKLAKKHNVKLLAYLPPLVEYNKELYSIYNNLEFDGKINLNDPELFPEFYDFEYIYDKGHLNYKGAELLTESFSIQIEALID